MTNTFLQPEHLCGELEREYPDIFRKIEFARQFVQAEGLTWPDWCYVPASTVEIVTKSYRPDKELLAIADSGRATALAAWRMGGKHVLQYHPEVIETLWNTPIEGEIPCAALMHFPFWCAYIPFPYPNLHPDLFGIFAQIQWNAESGRNEMWFTLHFAPRDSAAEPLGGLTPAIIDIEQNATVADAVNRSYAGFLEFQKSLGTKLADTLDTENMMRSMGDICSRALSIVLYVCAENAKMTPLGQPSSRPLPAAKGKRMFAPNKPNYWEVAYRIGAAIGTAKAAIAKVESTPTGRAMRPHLRRAHWHTFRRGRGRVDTVLHWLPPIPVNMPEDVDANEWAALLPTTVRPVN